MERKDKAPGEEEPARSESERALKTLDNYELMECIEKGLDRFGSSIKYSVMWRMVVLKEAPKEGITVKPEAFRAALQSIFGQSSSRIEAAIVEEITTRTGEDYPGVADFVELVNAVRKQSVLVQIHA